MTQQRDLERAAPPPEVEPELREVFQEEAADRLQTIRALLPALEAEDAETVQEVRRAAHTLKGSAAVVGFHALASLAHRMEDLLDRIGAEQQINTDITDLIKESTDRLEDLAAGQEDGAQLAELYVRYDRLLGREEAPALVRRDAPAATDATESFIRVPLDRLDEVVRLVGELTVAQARFEQHRSRRSQRKETGAAGPGVVLPCGDAEDLLGLQTRLTSEIHDRLMHIRLVPFGAVAARLRRTVRQVAERSQKPTDLVLEGESAEVDKAVLEDLAEPLMHLLRNAVDHGMEPAEQRRECGKPERGRILVRASHEADQIVLRISDDGRGINGEAVRRRAVERGFVPPIAAERMTEAELFALVFEPGFSTAREVSETSGRGVGLDVVRACVERLRGTVTLTSRTGVGATFTIRLPMTVAVMRALLVRASGQTFALPLASVARVVRLGVGAIDAGKDTLQIDESCYRRVALSDALNLGGAEEADSKRQSVLLVETGEGREAVVVDEVQGGREIVVKHLGAPLGKVHGVSGATLTGDGDVVLILNPLEFTRPPTLVASHRVEPAAPLSVLVVDDSPSIRRAMTDLLRREGWTPTEARDGQEALGLLDAEPALDLMLVDVDMPRMNGYDFLAAVKGRTAYRSVPVVMATSRCTDADRRRAEELGAEGYLVKPYLDEELVTLIRRLTATRRRERR
jgi:chemotaxis protein histidine kinase CheA/ActR/RegA family two-component response regulator